MKRTMLVCLVVVSILFMSGTVFALSGPLVIEGHGVITGLYVVDDEVKIGVEYGITPELAILVELRGAESKIGGKYELKPNLAVIAGIYDSSPFIGINGSRLLTRKLNGIFEADIVLETEEIFFKYQIGGRYSLRNKIDLRAGLIGTINGVEDTPKLQIGVGYHF